MKIVPYYRDIPRLRKNRPRRSFPSLNFWLKFIAGAQPLPEARAQRTLRAVGCSVLFGAGYVKNFRTNPDLLPTPPCLFTSLSLVGEPLHA
jgi:hypothetical protein